MPYSKLSYPKKSCKKLVFKNHDLLQIFAAKSVSKSHDLPTKKYTFLKSVLLEKSYKKLNTSRKDKVIMPFF